MKLMSVSKHTTLSLVSCGCETLSLTLSGRHRLGIFENRVLRVIYGFKGDEVRRCWIKMYNEKCYNVTYKGLWLIDGVWIR
jgi:hypothetical protein